jgi:formylmethanofuran dehydrogenase subunit B
MLVLGAEPIAAWPELPQLLTQPLGPQAEGAARRVLWLCPGGAAPEAQDAGAHIIGRDPADLPAALAVLRARLAGRRIDRIGMAEKVIDDLAAELRGARFGVAVWAAAELGSLATEMLGGIIDDLNESTRFSGLCLGPSDNATGVLQVCGWMTALPMRTGFGRGRPEHDPWRFDAARLVESGEADCALWISAYRAEAPQWRRPVPTIALTGAEAEWPLPPRVHIDVGRPGHDHDAVEHVMAAATLAAVPAANPSDRMPVARVLAEIAAALPGGASRGASRGASPC